MPAERSHSEQMDSISLRSTQLDHRGRTRVLHHFTGGLMSLMDRKGPLRKVSVIRAFQAAVEFAEGKK